MVVDSETETIPEDIPETLRQKTAVPNPVIAEISKAPESIPDKLKQTIQVEVTRCDETGPSTSRTPDRDSNEGSIVIDTETRAETNQTEIESLNSSIARLSVSKSRAVIVSSPESTSETTQPSPSKKSYCKSELLTPLVL